jgi:CheY-like chemotaxis protein
MVDKQAEGEMSKRKILLVDDEADILTVMKQLLESWGYEIFTASNGKDAIESLIVKKPDIMILDYIMPEMNGIDTLKEVRKINSAIPVIMFTAYPEQMPIKGREDLGINVFIPKTCEESALKVAISVMEGKIEKKT